MGFKQWFKKMNAEGNAYMKAKQLEKTEEKQYHKSRLAELKRDKIPYCRKCHSTNLTFNGKKLSVGRTIVGGGTGLLLLGPLAGGVGAVLGGFSSKKGKMRCMNCGKRWKI